MNKIKLIIEICAWMFIVSFCFVIILFPVSLFQTFGLLPNGGYLYYFELLLLGTCPTSLFVGYGLSLLFIDNL